MVRTGMIAMATMIALSSPAAFAGKKTAAYKEAKKECLQEKPDLKGKALQQCIAERTKK